MGFLDKRSFGFARVKLRRWLNLFEWRGSGGAAEGALNRWFCLGILRKVHVTGGVKLMLFDGPFSNHKPESAKYYFSRYLIIIQ